MFKDYDDPQQLRRIQVLLTRVLAEFDRVCTELGTPYVLYGGTAIGAVRHKGFIPWDDDVDVCMLREDYECFLAKAPAILDERFEIANSRTDVDFPNMFSVLGLRGTKFISEFIKDSPYKMPLSIDIFPLDTVPKGRCKSRLQMVQAWLWGRLMYMQGTPKPVLGFDSLLSRVIHVGTGFIYWTMKVLGVAPSDLQRRWERAARRYEGTRSASVTDMTDRNPSAWKVTPEELYPSVVTQFEDLMLPLPRNYDQVLTRGYGDYMELPPVGQRKNHQPFLVDLGQYAETDPS